MKQIVDSMLLTVFSILLFVVAAPAQQRSSTSSDNWTKDPIAFVHLLLGDDLSVRPSATGTPSVSVPDLVRQQILDTRVTWTVFRRASPFASGPRTLAIAPIKHDDKPSGVLQVMPRRAAGDTEICEAPYEKIPIDAPFVISGKIASFQAGIRPDGNIVVVVEIIEVSGCETRAPAQFTDLSGRWEFKRTAASKIKGEKGIMNLARDASCDQDGFACFTYQSADAVADKDLPRIWTVAIKESRIVICMGNRKVKCAISCAGVLTAEGKMNAQCRFILEMPAGDFTAERPK